MEHVLNEYNGYQMFLEPRVQQSMVVSSLRSERGVVSRSVGGMVAHSFLQESVIMCENAVFSGCKCILNTMQVFLKTF